MARHRVSRHLPRISGDSDCCPCQLHFYSNGSRSLPLRPGHLPFPHTSNVIRTLPSLYFTNTTQRKILAQPSKVRQHAPAPPKRIGDQRGHGEREPVRRSEGEETGHEELEYNETPKETGEGDSPCFAVGFVRFEVDCGDERIASRSRGPH